MKKVITYGTFDLFHEGHSAGKHVFCEKPMVMEKAQVEEVSTLGGNKAAWNRLRRRAV